MKVRARIVLFGVLLSAGLAWAQRDPVQATKGADVYLQKKCNVCHSINGKGGKAGPDLGAEGTKRDVPWLKAFLKDPKASNPKSKMMPFKGSDEELEALVAYLTSLK
jgi:mono/diheme cytochrome c family protein